MADLVAFDPGKTTGLAVLSFSDTTLPSLRAHDQLDVEQFFTALQLVASWTTPVTVVCEDFTLRRGRPMSSDQTLPMYLIGALQYVAYHNRSITLVMQTPAAAKQGVTDEHLENLGLLQTPKTKWDHANDALRHAVQYLKSIKHMPTLEGGFK